MISSDFVDRIINKYAVDEELRKLLIAHSECVASKSLEIAGQCGLDKEIDKQFVWDAAMLHDIGIVRCNAPSIHCKGDLPYICHGVAGAEILRSEGLDDKFCRVCERHTGSGLTADEIKNQNLPLPHRDFIPETIEEKLICYADKFYSKSGDPTCEKSRDRIIGSMSRHGEDALRRFKELDLLFTPKK